MKKGPILIIFGLFIYVAGCTQNNKPEIRDDFKNYYEEFQVKGSFALYDQNEERYILYNETQFRKPFIPASTFKIYNSLIGLETGVISDENFIIPWDGLSRNPVWDKDHDLKSAFKNSTVWYYQELARRVGGTQMKMWLDRINYGNQDTTGGIDKFWLEGGLRITPEQQIVLLRQLFANQLPFSARSMEIVKGIMIEADTADHVLRSKTGWGTQSDTDIGWYVGYVETKDNVYYFSNCVQSPGQSNNRIEDAIRFDKSRKEITYRILDDLNIIQTGGSQIH